MDGNVERMLGFPLMAMSIVFVSCMDFKCRENKWRICWAITIDGLVALNISEMDYFYIVHPATDADGISFDRTLRLGSCIS